MTQALASHSPITVREVSRTGTFPSVVLPAGPGRPPIEVHLVGRLGPGAGDKLFFEALARQRKHEHFVDALDEPSARLGGTHFPQEDPTALYSFGVGPQGHPFHKHAGHRVFTAVSGSGGALLRFAAASDEDLARDPHCIVAALRQVQVPPDCLFTVRFSGGTWHQFTPLSHGGRHPALFAMSTHTNELGGPLSEHLRRQVLEGQADIPSLTQLLPPQAVQYLARLDGGWLGVPTTILSLDDRPDGLQERACRLVRSWSGHLQRVRTAWWMRPGYVSRGLAAQVHIMDTPDQDSLLLGELNDMRVHHEDCFTAEVARRPDCTWTAERWLAALLQGFLEHRPLGVSRLMALRNALVSPLGLRTSPLGCPVSSLLGPCTHTLFDGRFPVRSLRVSADGKRAEVILGADDRHLVFRACVGVRVTAEGVVRFSLSNRVACLNMFGRFYMRMIAATHRDYVGPTLLAHAVEAASHAAAQQARPCTPPPCQGPASGSLTNPIFASPARDASARVSATGP